MAIVVPIVSTWNPSGLKRATADIKRAEGGLNKFGAAAKALGPLVAVGAAVGSAALVKMAADSVQAANDMAESLNKVEAVFGSSGREVVAWSEDTVAALGMSSGAALEAAGSYGNLLTSFGVASDTAAEMSIRITELAADLNSFNNRTDAAQALLSGLSGEMEPLKKFGVVLSDVRLKAEALAMGLEVTSKPLDPLTKSMAAYSLILKDTTNAQGDFARTADGLANTQRVLSAAVQDAKEEIGQGLLYGIQAATDAMGGSGGMSETIGDLTDDVADFTYGLGVLTSKFVGLNKQIADATNNSLDLAKIYRGSLAIGTAGISEGVIRAAEGIMKLGEETRLNEEASKDAAEAAYALEAGYRANAAAARDAAAAAWEATKASQAYTSAADILSLSRKEIQQQDAAGRARWIKFDEDLAARRKAQEELNKEIKRGGGASSAAAAAENKYAEAAERVADAFDAQVVKLNEAIEARDAVQELYDDMANGINSYLSNTVDIGAAFSANEDAKKAAEEAGEAFAGTWVTAFKQQIEDAQELDAALKAVLATLNPADTLGNERLLEQLLALDPATAKKVADDIVNQGIGPALAADLSSLDFDAGTAWADQFYQAGLDSANNTVTAISNQVKADLGKYKAIGKKAGDAFMEGYRAAVAGLPAGYNPSRSTRSGDSVTRSTPVYNVTVNAPLGDPIAVSRALDDVLRKSERRTGGRL